MFLFKRLFQLIIIVLFACISCGGFLDKDISSKSLDINALFDTILSRPILPSDDISSNTICTDYSRQGLLIIRYNNKMNTNYKFKLQVIKDENTINYNIKGNGLMEKFPLQYGDGKYTARILKNIRDDEYISIDEKVFWVQLDNENIVFLNSVQNIDWDYSMAPIKDLPFIIENSLQSTDDSNINFRCIECVYKYIAKNIKYDDEKVDDLTYDYVPDIEQVYEDRKGICYDYASLFAAMLRSINIPTKLIKGYTSFSPDKYHAWNEVLIDNEWFIVDITLDACIFRSKQLCFKDSNKYIKVYEY